MMEMRTTIRNTRMEQFKLGEPIRVLLIQKVTNFPSTINHQYIWRTSKWSGCSLDVVGHGVTAYLVAWYVGCGSYN